MINIKISPAVMVSFALALFTASILLLSGFFGLFPDREKENIVNRKILAESLAVQLTLLVANSQFRLAEQTIEGFIERNPETTAALMETKTGLALVEVGDTARLRAAQEGSLSTDTHLKVPLLKGTRDWGTLHIQLEPVYKYGWISWFSQSIYGLSLVLASSGFFGYLFIIRRTLRVLDPKNVIPERVKSAFNTLTEGVIIIDEKQHILLANTIFGEKVNRPADTLIGLNIASFGWSLRKDDTVEYPWVTALDKGCSVTGVLMYLNTDNGRYSLSTNCSIIADDKENARGALVTFEDTSELENKNVKLGKLISRLRETEAEIKEKNISLVHLANYDPLTNCYNRRAFFERFDTFFSGAARLACLMVDIDHFKLVNDNYGHAAGDEAIQFMASVLQNQSRENDLVGRYGGEEFCVVMPGANATEAGEIAERIRVTLEEQSVVKLAQIGKMTVSIGVSTLDSLPKTPSEMVDLADKALYVAKESGRNRVVHYDAEHDKASA